MCSDQNADSFQIVQFLGMTEEAKYSFLITHHTSYW